LFRQTTRSWQTDGQTKISQQHSVYHIYSRISRSVHKSTPKNRVDMWSKIIDPCIIHRWFWRLVLDAESKHNPRHRCYRRRRLSNSSSAASLTWYVESCVFWRLEKFLYFYDPVISRPQLFGQDFVVNFCDLYTRMVSTEFQRVKWLKFTNRPTLSTTIPFNLILVPDTRHNERWHLQ